MKRYSLLFFSFCLLFNMFSIENVMGQEGLDTIKIKSGDHMMYGINYSGGTEEKAPSLMLLHGFPGGYGDVLGVGEAISKSGINVFVLTLSGISISEGVYGGDSPLVDLENAIDFFFSPAQIEKYNIDTTDFIIGGWSFGGGLSLYKGAHDSRVKRIISIAGFNGDAFLTQCEKEPDFKKFMQTIFMSYTMRKIIDFKPMSAINDLEEYRDAFTPVAFAEKIAQKPLLLFGGTDDAEVRLTDHIMPYYRAVKSKGGKVKFHVYQTGHRFGGHRDQLHEDIINWIKQQD